MWEFVIILAGGSPDGLSFLLEVPEAKAWTANAFPCLFLSIFLLHPLFPSFPWWEYLIHFNSSPGMEKISFACTTEISQSVSHSLNSGRLESVHAQHGEVSLWHGELSKRDWKTLSDRNSGFVSNWCTLHWNVNFFLLSCNFRYSVSKSQKNYV